MGSIWLGDPGARWMIRNERIDTKKRVMIFWIMLLAKKETTYYSPVEKLGTSDSLTHLLK